MWAISRLALLCACLTFYSLVGVPSVASASPRLTRRASASFPEATLSPFTTAQNASVGDIKAARQIVQDAIGEMTKRNKARLANPIRGNSRLNRGANRSKRDDGLLTSLLDITDEMALAAALLAELDGKPPSNDTSSTPSDPVEKRAGAFWMEGIARQGTVPWGNDASYKVSIINASICENMAVLIS